MLNTKKWVSYAALLECPENLGVKNPHELKAAYHPSTDSLEILNSSSLESRDKKILKEILCQEEAFGYYPIGEFRGRIYLTTDMVSPSSRIFDRMDFPKYMAEVLRIYAQCHGNTHYVLSDVNGLRQALTLWKLCQRIWKNCLLPFGPPLSLVTAKFT